MRTDSQKLIDICFQCVLTVLDHEHIETFQKMSIEERATWVASQLRACGFDTKPVGACWGALINGPERKSITQLDQRRLRDADAALMLSEPANHEELLRQLGVTGDAIAALQSLDDLGAEANALANSKMIVLQEKHNRLKARLGRS